MWKYWAYVMGLLGKHVKEMKIVEAKEYNVNTNTKK
jgi:hypothetical protein